MKLINIKIIKKSEFFQNILKIFSSTGLSQLIQIIGSLYLAKAYVPADFGIFSLFMSILMFMVVLATLRYESAIIVEKNDGVVKMIMNTLFVYMLLFSSFLFLVLLLLPETFLVHFNINEFYLLIPLGTFVYSFYNTLMSYFVRVKRFGLIAKMKISIAILIVAFQLLFFYLQIKNGLILGFSLGYFIVSLYMFFVLKQRLVIQSKKRILLAFSKYFYLVKFGLPTQIIDTVSNAALPVLIVMWFNLEVAGIYFFAYKMTNLPLQLIGVSIGKVFYQKASHLFNHDKESLRNFVLKIIGLTSIIVIIPLILMFFFSKDIILLVVGEEWAEAGDYISILVIMFFFRTIISAISPLADILKKLNVIFIFSIITFFTYVGAMYVGNIYDDFFLAIKILSISIALLYLVQIIYFINILKYKK